MGNKIVVVVMHILSSSFAFCVSLVQTQRILTDVRKYNRAIIFFFVVGGLLAGGGTILIAKGAKENRKYLQEIKNKINK